MNSKYKYAFTYVLKKVTHTTNKLLPFFIII